MENAIRYHSQCQEDRWIIENLKPGPGYFLEVGSFDGVLSSNTIAFEDLGWGGLLVEADPLLAAQSLIHRKANTICCAAGCGPGLQEFFINEADRGLSGLERSWPKSIWVPVLPLANLIGCVHVNLLSIDTEGTELEVWATRGQSRPDIVIIEHQTLNEPSNREPILKQFAFDNYKLRHETQYNLIFTSE